jgi:hypothetical protein
MSEKNTTCGCNTLPKFMIEKNLVPTGRWITEYRTTEQGIVPVAATELSLHDRLGAFRARWGIMRMRYTVMPGLYAVGDADTSSPVFVSANYKLSFDALRGELAGLAAWILVLDTKGINVWCAAGKGALGTAELVRRIAETGLAKQVAHRRLILPQLGAPGVAAHVVEEKTGFKVSYGPVKAQDIKEYLTKGMRKTEAMRRKDFPMQDRLVLTPIELIQSLKYYAIGILLFGLVALLRGSLLSTGFLLDSIFLLAAFVAGTVFFPLLLPWLPGRPFSFKGWILGLVVATGAFVLTDGALVARLSYFLFLPAITAFIALNFTGASTYTNMTGVRREMGFAVPIILITAVSGLALKFIF